MIKITIHSDVTLFHMAIVMLCILIIINLSIVIINDENLSSQILKNINVLHIKQFIHTLCQRHGN